jgi:hypothetical protein
LQEWVDGPHLESLFQVPSFAIESALPGASGAITRPWKLSIGAGTSMSISLEKY